MVRAVRGAVQLEENSVNAVLKNVSAMIEGLLVQNSLEEENIISIQFTQTADVTALNPAAALRQKGFGEVPLFCAQEPDYQGSLPRMIRVLITAHVEDGRRLTPLYLGGAKQLRPDLG
jgi:chorismate mutase